MQLGVAPTPLPRTAKPVTFVGGELRAYAWSSDGSTIQYVVDGPQSHSRLSSIDLLSLRTRTLFDAEGPIPFFVPSATNPHSAIFGAVHGASKWLDVFSVDTRNGKLALMLRKASLDSVLVDRDLHPVIGLHRSARRYGSVFSRWQA